MTTGIYLICLYGPESTGKSVMTDRLAKLYQTVSVPEVAKELITSNDFSVEDIIRIGKAQNQRIKEKLPSANKLLFCDTDLITTQIYSRQYLGHIPPILLELEKQIHYDHYFLFDIDVPWVADGLRDLGHQRNEMMAAFRSALEQRRIEFTLVKGDWTQRESIIVRAIQRLFDISPGPL